MVGVGSVPSMAFAAIAFPCPCRLPDIRHPDGLRRLVEHFGHIARDPLCPQQGGRWEVSFPPKHHHALSGKTFTFPDGLPEHGYRFKAIDFALPTTPRHG